MKLAYTQRYHLCYGFRHSWFVSGACPDKRFEVPPRNLLFHAKR